MGVSKKMKKAVKRSVGFILFFLMFLFPIKSNAAWLKSEEGWQYWDEKKEAFAKGMTKIGTETFYFDTLTRVMHTGWKRVGTAQYYFRDNGVMAKNSWISGRYYVGKDGKMVKGKWIAPNGESSDEKLYFDRNGVWLEGYRSDIKEGFQKDTKGYKYQNYDGEYLDGGWKRIQGSWRYFYSSGYMATARWLNDYCYVDEQGCLVREQWVDDKYIGKNGRWDPSVQKEE